MEANAEVANVRGNAWTRISRNNNARDDPRMIAKETYRAGSQWGCHGPSSETEHCGRGMWRLDEEMDKVRRNVVTGENGFSRWTSKGQSSAMIGVSRPCS